MYLHIMKFIYERNRKTGTFAKNEVLCKGVKSLGKEGSARGEEPLFKAVFSSRIHLMRET